MTDRNYECMRSQSTSSSDVNKTTLCCYTLNSCMLSPYLRKTLQYFDELRGGLWRVRDGHPVCVSFGPLKLVDRRWGIVSGQFVTNIHCKKGTQHVHQNRLVDALRKSHEVPDERHAVTTKSKLFCMLRWTKGFGGGGTCRRQQSICGTRCVAPMRCC
jgi:hypothetical protein